MADPGVLCPGSRFSRPGRCSIRGKALGARTTTQQARWDQLTPIQQYLLEMLGIEAPEEDEVVVPVRRSQDER